MTVAVVLTLIQDLALAGPLLRFCADRDPLVLIAKRLADEPRAEARLAELTAGRAHAVFASPGEALAALAPRAGLVVLVSESRVNDHRPAHALARALPSRFLSATLQHGFECIGFLHNAAHEAMREGAGFASDIACAWFDAARLTALPFADAEKAMTTGSTVFLDPEPAAWLGKVLSGAPAPPPGDGPLLVCENLQSPRLAGAPAATFAQALCELAAARPVTVRPHPAGAFAKGTETPPPGVTLDARPIEEADLAQYAAAVSPPSTVLFDIMRHDVPVAVWRDHGGIVDDRLYGALPRVTTARDILAFADGAPSAEPNRAYLRTLGFPADTRARFEALMRLGDDVASWDLA